MDGPSNAAVLDHISAAQNWPINAGRGRGRSDRSNTGIRDGMPTLMEKSRPRGRRSGHGGTIECRWSPRRQSASAGRRENTNAVCHTLPIPSLIYPYLSEAVKARIPVAGGPVVWSSLVVVVCVRMCVSARESSVVGKGIYWSQLRVNTLNTVVNTFVQYVRLQ